MVTHRYQQLPCRSLASLSFPSKNQPQDRYKPYNPTNHFKNQPQNIKSTDTNFINLTNHSKNQLQDLYIQYNSTCYLYFRKNSKKKKNFSRNERKHYSVAGSKGKESNARRADRRRAPAVGDSPPVTRLPASRTLASLAGSWLLRLQQQQKKGGGRARQDNSDREKEVAPHWLGAGFRTSSGGGRHGLALPHPAVRMAAATKGRGDGYSLLAPPRFELSRPRGRAAHGRGGRVRVRDGVPWIGAGEASGGGGGGER